MEESKNLTLVTINIAFCKGIGCRFLETIDIKVDGRLIKEIPRCNRLDCDNWISRNNSQMDIEIL